MARCPFYGDDSFNLIENRGSGGGYAGEGASLANELDFTVQNLYSGQKKAAVLERCSSMNWSTSGGSGGHV